MIQELQLRLLPEEAVNEQSLKRVAARETGAPVKDVNAVRVLKRSVDARQRTIYVNVRLRIFINEQPEEPEYPSITYPDVSGGKPVVVVGAGPGGLFAALRLIELGLRPIIIERGKNVRERKKDIALISREHLVNSESNYSFGEGGAGAYSDGKLYTRSKKRGSVEKILQVFCQFGASTAILADAHPHIGTDKLPRVIENIREQIIRSGGEVHFETRMDALIIRNNEVVGVETNTGKSFYGPVILATGHSARDVYRYLYRQQIPVEAKGIAVGVRLEHPQALIDQIQYHRREGRGEYLPAAEYSFVTQATGRGVYSFCMCPGGFVVPAASGPKQVVVNGMSPSNRGSRWANSGMVVEIRPEDFAALTKEEKLQLDGEEIKADSPLALMAFQERLEELCWLNGGMKQTAPAQRMADFIQKKNSFDLPESSYTPGLLASPLHFWIPEFVTGRLREGFRHFGKVSKGFLTNEALMIGVETRTSAPVRILRDKESFQHVTLKGLFPCGEGAGYAGGIVSAAIDGERCAEGVIQRGHGQIGQTSGIF
ncbi:NAD(P)/FAD-dependent oxidoreductase [Parabacteroides sp. AM08-6]|uniref:NAD(P)/FAD-dependent oxidoreductase n=1 Tax=Parabacteroides sp. AM08-6 TaxID=2292053 RepID=UPI000EFF12C7|nr:FAD-binding protein [Parabacteroides sp. AM08-6]RHJ83226.1 FAD-binding protein [Parabacteroides sp. AM08-6]